jgi:hypothetical protein
MRHVMAAQPHRQMWNRTVLSALWADIGVGPLLVREFARPASSARKQLKLF